MISGFADVLTALETGGIDGAVLAESCLSLAASH